MKITRLKKVNKHLKFYRNNFGFRKPYQILIDGTFCFIALKEKVFIQEKLKNYVDTDIKLLTTRCVIVEMELLGKHLSGALAIAKQFSVHKCGHEANPIPGSKCLKSMIAKGNPNRYIIATQDRELQTKARRMPGIPIIYLYKNIPILEEPSQKSIKAAEKKCTEKTGVRKLDEENISRMKEELGLEKEEIKKKKRKKKGGPNPLSCKKSKKIKANLVVENNPNTGIKKRKRRRIRLPEHVKAELFKS